MSRNWSIQQQSIFEWFKAGQGNLIVRARAGTGKTTTILEGVKYAPETKILLAAFNKTIATELQKKLSAPAEAKTLHALGFSYVGRNWSKIKVDSERGMKLAEKALERNTPIGIIAMVRKLASLAKQCCPYLNPDCVTDLAYEHDCIPDYPNWTVNKVVDAAIDAANRALEFDGTIDFDDMLFVPVRHGWIQRKYELVVIDEAQDMNASQLILARGSCKGRIAVVGDDRQAIYGFRGADSGAIDRLKTELSATELGLTITYRCPKLVVQHAQALVPDYQAAETAIDGTIRNVEYKDLATDVMPGDFVLSRKNAPLAGACLSILRAGKPAKISGRDVAKTLLSLVNKWKDNGIINFLEKLTAWEEKEIVKANTYPERKRENRIQLVQDQAETIRVLAEGCEELNELQRRIENMFVDEALNPLGVVLCSTIHKAKGQERNRVFLFGDTLYPRGRNGVLEEKNLEYVGVTRAIQELIWVDNVG